MKYIPNLPLPASFEALANPLNLNVLNTSIHMTRGKAQIAYNRELEMFYCECGGRVAAIFHKTGTQYVAAIVSLISLFRSIKNQTIPTDHILGKTDFDFESAQAMFVGLCFTDISEAESKILSRYALSTRGDIVLLNLGNGFTVRVSGSANIHYPKTFANIVYRNTPLAGVFFERDGFIENMTKFCRKVGPDRAHFLNLVESARAFDVDVVKACELRPGDRVRHNTQDAFCRSASADGAVIEYFNAMLPIVVLPDTTLVKVNGVL